MAVAGASAFGKNYHGHAPAQGFGGAVQAAHGRGGAGGVNRNLPRAPQVPSQKGIVEQFFLGNDAKLKWKLGVDHRDIERRDVIEGVKVRLGDVNVVEPTHCNARHATLQDQPRPQPGEAVLQASARVKERRDQGKTAQNSGIDEDQRIEDEIRPQAAQYRSKSRFLFGHVREVPGIIYGPEECAGPLLQCKSNR